MHDGVLSEEIQEMLLNRLFMFFMMTIWCNIIMVINGIWPQEGAIFVFQSPPCCQFTLIIMIIYISPGGVSCVIYVTMNCLFRTFQINLNCFNKKDQPNCD